jgi:hypothetical protein
MGVMRRTVVLAAVWLVVAGGAVAVAWQGVAVVGNQVTDDRPAPLAASEIESRLAESTTTAGAADAPTSTTSSAPPADSGSGGAEPGPVASGVVTTQPATSPTAPPPTTAPPPAAVAETRTYNLQGGTASLRFAPSGVTVVFANPAPGFAVSVEPEHGNGVKVEFESEAHESRVDGWWENGPVDRVQEESDG